MLFVFIDKLNSVLQWSNTLNDKIQHLLPTLGNTQKLAPTATDNSSTITNVDASVVAFQMLPVVRVPRKIDLQKVIYNVFDLEKT
jgi:hypothetical protein